ncbi:MAG: DUF2169 domain-containing protein [Myxococcota bacterium]
MTLANATPFAALDVPMEDARGREMVLVVVKGTFDQRGGVLDLQQPVWVADVPWEPDADASSVRWPSDVAVDKPGADVVVVGQARAATPVRHVDVTVQVGPRKAELRVHGPRRFCRGAEGIVPGQSAPFRAQTIRYEGAYGGTGDAVIERRNPIGLGVADDLASLVDAPAPTIAWRDDAFTVAGRAVEPAGLGAIAPHWMPRAGYAGTFDAAWETERMPLLPEDFDPRYTRCAHPRLQFETRLAPGTPFSVEGMTEAAPVRATVPALDAVVEATFDDGARENVGIEIDTMVIDLELEAFPEPRIIVVGRAAFPRGRGQRRLLALRVEAKP